MSEHRRYFNRLTSPDRRDASGLVCPAYLLPGFFRFMTRGLGTRETASPDILSLLMFQANYLGRLIELGEADADARADEIEAFIAAK